MTIRLALVGAGHANLHVITRAADLRRVGIEPTVVAPPHFSYSGMGSAVAGGTVGPAANRIDVAALCRRHDVPHLPGIVTGLDLATRRLDVDGGRVVDTDLLSLNVGSDAATGDIEVGPEVVRVKPLVGLAGLPARIDALPEGAHVVVVGGGATASELAANVAHRLHRTGRDGWRVTVLSRPFLPVETTDEHVGRRILAHLVGLGVVWRGGSTVTSVGGGVAVLTDVRGRRHEVAHDLAVLAVGLRPSATVAKLGLADHDGHLPVDEHLTHVAHDWVLGAGDAARFLPRPLPKIGVFGVRAGPAIVDVLLARARGEPPPAFEPQDDFLAILDLATTGLAIRGDLFWARRPSLLAKRLIDSRWLARYR